MNINVTKPTGVICKTQGKYCAEDITVVPTLEEKSVTPTASAQEIVPSTGNCGISKVNVGAVQTETKGVTPSTSAQTVTPTSGKFLSQVDVAAIPSDYVIPTGTLQITANGAKDVTNYKNVNVNVAPNLEQKTVTITENGTTDVTPTTGKDGMSKVTVNVNVPTSGGVEEVATAAAMDALLVEANVGKYYKFTGTTDSNYTNGDLYLVEGGAVSTGETWLLDTTLTSYNITKSASFKSKNADWTLLARFYYEDPDRGKVTDDYLKYNDTIVYTTIGGTGWKDQAYRTITFAEPVTDTELLNWLQGNGTKQ